MTELISLITAKPNWENKINDVTIVNKWKDELKTQGVKSIFLDLVIDLLRNYKNSHNKHYNDIDSYQWVIDIDNDQNEFGIADECDCQCNICQGKEYLDDSDYESFDEDADDEREDIECKCTLVKLENKKREFLHKYVSFTDHLIDETSKSLFKQQVEKLEQRLPIDYHPGSNNQVIDLVHPSMFCYVKGVTQTRVKMDDNVLFQWLPSEFNIKDGKVKINSYINNLDPLVDSDLYDSIANIFAKFVPQFEQVLSTLHVNGKIDHYQSLTECQVIVKLANMVLTPNAPIFPPGSWHLEGLPYEKIVATGIYYYEMNNITPNTLNFRSTMTRIDTVEYPQDSPLYVETHYGFEGEVEDNDRKNQGTIINLGEIETKEDRCLVFPNFLQHQVSSFTLQNNTKIGTRKILVFFLINPATKILSTKDVKPQQDLIPLAEAKIYRELLMFQRKYEISDQNSFFERGWSLCEH